MKKNILIFLFVAICNLYSFSQTYVILPKEGKSIIPDNVELKTDKILQYTVQGNSREIAITDIETVFKDGIEISVQEFIKILEVEKEKKKLQTVNDESSKEAETSPASKPVQRVIPNESQTSESSLDYSVFSELDLQMTLSLGSYTWAEAKQVCENLTRGGFSDWYLPSRFEFEMILKQNPDFKTKLTKFWHWTSSEKDNKEAYNISSNGWVTGEKKSNNGPDCMCVRKIR